VSRIVVATSHPPFAEGGHLVIARSLVTALREAGHEADLLMTPQNRFGRQAAAYLATRLTDVSLSHDGQRVDQIITLRYPSYALKHEAHVCWLNHTMREYYDLWDRWAGRLSWKGRLKERTRRRLIHMTDRYLLTRNVTRLFAQSKTVQERMKQFAGISAEVLYPPAPPRPYRCEGYGDYLFVVSRLAPLKRVDLIVQALARPEAAGVRCVIAGEGEERDAIAHLIAASGLSERVRLAGRINETELVEYLSRCRAVCFVPFQEDYGFVTAEAFASKKPVITCHDSGGPAELVEDGVSGFISDPTANGLAVAIRRVMDDAGLAERLGRGGHRHASRLSWPDAVRRLVIV